MGGTQLESATYSTHSQNQNGGKRHKSCHFPPFSQIRHIIRSKPRCNFRNITRFSTIQVPKARDSAWAATYEAP